MEDLKRIEEKKNKTEEELKPMKREKKIFYFI